VLRRRGLRLTPSIPLFSGARSLCWHVSPRSMRRVLTLILVVKPLPPEPALGTKPPLCRLRHRPTSISDASVRSLPQTRSILPAHLLSPLSTDTHVPLSKKPRRRAFFPFLSPFFLDPFVSTGVLASLPPPVSCFRGGLLLSADTVLPLQCLPLCFLLF